MSTSNSSQSRRDFVTKTGAVTGMGALAALLGGGTVVNAAEFPALNAIGPTPEQAEAFFALPDNQPVVMVNLIKFKPNGGREDYLAYAKSAPAELAKVGARFIFSGDCHGTFIGGTEWDMVILVRYPNAGALREYSQAPAMAANSANRLAGLEGQMNLTVFETTEEFAEI